MKAMRIIAIALAATTAWAPLASADVTVRDYVAELRNNLTGGSGPFKPGTRVDFLGGSLLLRGTLRDGSTAIVQMEAAPNRNGTGFAEGGPLFHTVEERLEVKRWANRPVANPGIPGRPGRPVRGGDRVSDTDIPDTPVPSASRARTAASSTDVAETPVIASASTTTAAVGLIQPTPQPCNGALLHFYNEYQYGITWCRVSNQASIRRKNYFYMFPNGASALILTMDFSCASTSDRQAMPNPKVRGTC